MPDISHIQLPSGSIYDIKDLGARQLIDNLSTIVSGGVSFIIAWNGASAPTAANIPAGVVVRYNNTNTTGTLAVTAAALGAFYLVKSATVPGDDTNDAYDEYTVIKPDSEDNTTWFWEKIGDTRVSLTDIVKNVTLNKQTDTVIGADSTFTITQPTIALATGATAGTGVISVATGITSAAASGDNVTALTGLGSPSTKSAIGANSTFKITQPTVELSSNNAIATGRVQVVTGVTPSNTYVKATATGANTAWDSKDTKTAITGYASPTSDTFVKTITPTTQKLATASVTGVSGSTTASKATAGTAQTTVSGFASSSSNSDFMADVSVSNGTLVLHARSLSTQSTPQYTFADVTVPKAATSATTVATGSVTASGSGASIVTDVAAGSTASALTGLGDPSTASVIGASSTFTVTQPTVALATDTTTGTGKVSVTTGVTPVSTYLGATATGAKTEWNSKDAVAAVTGYANPTTDDVLGASSTITVTPTTTNIKATASGANTTWNNKDSVTVLTNATDITTTKN